jgi:UDPglucose 6-dehydrogenase
MARRVSVSFAGVLRGKTVAILGLTFKPNTDDMREVPSIPLIMALQDMGAKVRAFDPVGMEEAKNCLLLRIIRLRRRGRCCGDRHRVGRALDLAKFRDLMACPVVVDLRNVYRPEDMKKRGSSTHVWAARRPINP